MNHVMFKRKSSKSSKLCISLLVFAIILVYLPATSAKADVIYATDDVEYLHVDSPIVLKFDKEIKFDSTLVPTPGTPSSTFNGITLFDETDQSVSIRLEIEGNRLNVIPDPALEENKDYRLEITNDIVTDLSRGYVFEDEEALSSDIEYEFSTYSLTFLELMQSDGKITELIKEFNFTPRQIMVTAPRRYIDEMEVMHRQKGIQEQVTESVTNIDIDIDDPDGKVARIVVKAGGQTVERKYLNASSNSGSQTYDFAFTGLPDEGTYDMTITVYNSVDKEEKENILDSRVIKVSLEDETTTTVKFKNSYKMAGKSFTLYDLLAKENNLQKMLNENPMEGLNVQVVEAE